MIGAPCPDAIDLQFRAFLHDLPPGFITLLDAIVVGAGPAGNQTALKLAEAGHDVLVVDYRTRLGDKLCTGIIGRECFERYSVPKEMVLQEARSARFTTASPGEVVIARQNPQAYVIDRIRFVSEIADRAADKGASYMTGTLVTSIDVGADCVEVGLRADGEFRKLKSRAIVVASGAGSKLAEMAGLSPARNLAYASQAVVDAHIDPEVTVMLPGALPTGHFGWLVSRGDGKALLGVLGKPRQTGVEQQVLLAAQSAGLAGARSGDWQRWPVPVGPAPVTVNHRALLVGDAAGQVKPATGGGIYYSLIAADLAAETLDRSLRADDLSVRSLSSYDTAWKSVLGRELRVGRIARSIFERLDGPAIERLLRIAEASGFLDEDGSFDWHSKLIIRGLTYRMFDAAFSPFRAVSSAISAIA